MNSGRFPFLLLLLLLLQALAAAQHPADPYKEVNPSASTQGTAKEPLRGGLSLKAAADYLDRHAHLAENHCYACHSTFAYLPARSLIDPLAEEVMRTRILLERLMTMAADPQRAPEVKTAHLSRLRILAPVELARHDAATTGKLAPVTRQSLEAMWKLQKPDGGIDWIRVHEAPQAVDDWWPAVLIALGVSVAPEGYAGTEPAATHLERLRGWFRAHPPQTLHERCLTLVAESAIGGILDSASRGRNIEAVFARQRADGGWSIADLAPWQRKDQKPLNPAQSDGYATALSAYAVARSGVPPAEPRLRKAVSWIKTQQRESGGWFTQSPFARDKLASNTGTSFAIQALAACGELVPPKVTPEQFAAAHGKAEAEVPAGQYVPHPNPP